MTDTRSFMRVVATVAVALYLVSAIAIAAPGQPAAYYGPVQDENGTPAPTGTTIVAVVDGEVVDSITVDDAGQYGDSSPTADKLDADTNDGDTISFHVGSADGPKASPPGDHPLESGTHQLELVFPAGTFGEQTTTESSSGGGSGPQGTESTTTTTSSSGGGGQQVGTTTTEASGTSTTGGEVTETTASTSGDDTATTRQGDETTATTPGDEPTDSGPDDESSTSTTGDHETTSTELGETTTEQPSERTTNTTTPGFGIMSLVSALAIAVLVRRQRR